ncbi:MAG: glycosyltransferase family 9 protein [Candidatus Omnitrophica bacterium]|nr:glycosyltransferase family 9 protein [Candidatus Omnitrophota bacterium]
MSFRNLIRFCLFTLTDSVIYMGRNPRQVKSNSILLVRLDDIGDYILFRNFIQVLKKSDKYRGYSITLCGNLAWKEIAETFDREYIEEYIWVDNKRLEKDLVYRYKKLKEIRSKGYEVAIHPVYSRRFYYGDNIIKLVSAKEKIGSTGNFSNIKKWQKYIADKYYTKLVPAKKNTLFELFRNKEFFENLLNEKNDIGKTSLELTMVKNIIKLPENYVVLFIGAGKKWRKWPSEYFAEAAKFICKNYGLQIFICGAKDDESNADKIREILTGFEVHDLTDKTSLVDLVLIISKAKLLISNETLAPHIAMAVNTQTIVLSNGLHFGRFTPYPISITDKYHALYPPEIENHSNDYKELSNRYSYESKLNIGEIKVEKLIKKVDEVMEKIGIKKCF